MNKPDEKQPWEEELLELAINKALKKEFDYFKFNRYIDQIKVFIRSLLKKQRQELQQQVLEAVGEFEFEGDPEAQAVNDIISIIRKRIEAIFSERKK